MKILVTVNDNSIVRNILRSGAFLETLHRGGHEVTLVCNKEKHDSYAREFGNSQVTVRVFTAYSSSFFEKIVRFCARNIFYSESNLLFQERAAALGQSKVPLFIKKLLVALLGHSFAWKHFVRMFDAHIQPRAEVIKLFDEVIPDVVFSTTIMDEVVDTPILREAKHRGIHTVGMTRSWDNLSSYGFFRVVPDVFIAQNEFLADIARTLQAVPSENIVVTGDPYYDNFARKDLLVSREVFFQSLGIDQTKRLILYAAIGDELFLHEGELAPIFEALIEEGMIPKNSHILFRAHPAFQSPLETMKHLTHVTPDRGARYETSNLETWDMDTTKVAHFVNSLHHADVVVTAGSTVIIDAVAYGKPVVSVAFDGYATVDPLFSVRSYMERTTHLQALLKTGGFRLAHDKEELARYITRYLSDGNADSTERAQLKKRFATPLSGDAGVRIAHILTESVKK